MDVVGLKRTILLCLTLLAAAPGLDLHDRAVAAVPHLG